MIRPSISMSIGAIAVHGEVHPWEDRPSDRDVRSRNHVANMRENAVVPAGATWPRGAGARFESCSVATSPKSQVFVHRALVRAIRLQREGGGWRAVTACLSNN